MEMQDKIKLMLSVACIVAGIVAFYMIPDAHGMLLKSLAFVGGLIVAGVIAVFSGPGKDFVRYTQESVAEGRKIVWPTRREAMQVTALVAVFVCVLALFMWLVDSGLAWLFYDVILG